MHAYFPNPSLQKWTSSSIPNHLQLAACTDINCDGQAEFTPNPGFETGQKNGSLRGKATLAGINYGLPLGLQY